MDGVYIYARGVLVEGGKLKKKNLGAFLRFGRGKGLGNGKKKNWAFFLYSGARIIVSQKWWLLKKIGKKLEKNMGILHALT